MRWTPEKVAELRALAPLGARVVAERLGVSRKAAQAVGVKHRIPLGSRGQACYDGRKTEDRKLRARWAAMLPQKLEAIRRDMAVIMGEAGWRARLAADLREPERRDREPR